MMLRLAPHCELVSNVLLGCAVFITANISGGHLNPAVTLATMFTGHISIPRGVTYIFCQICGAVFGILIVVSPVQQPFMTLGE